jgi:ATP-binding cassette subfamily C (CFTR/MRP) protein 1
MLMMSKGRYPSIYIPANCFARAMDSYGIFRTRLSIPAAVFGFLDAAVIFGLSLLEHSRSVRPSTLLQVYLLLSLLFDAARARTLWLISSHDSIAKTFIAAVVVKFCIATLESTEKRRLLKTEYKSLTVESTSGVLNVSIFWWLNRLLRSGTRNIFCLDDLEDMKQEFRSNVLQNSLEDSWSNGMLWSSFILHLCFSPRYTC